MRRVLHILTRPSDLLVREMIARQQTSAENAVVVADLTQGRPDYAQLLEEVLAADSVQCW